MEGLSRSAYKKAEYRRQTIFAWAFTGLQIALVIFALVRFVLVPVRVNGASMLPTLTEGEVLLIDKVSLFLRTPPRGSMVVFTLPGMEETLIKRIIAMPGETVQIKEGSVYVNGRLLDESAYAPSMKEVEDFDALVVPEAQIFVLGDDRPLSLDSRDPAIGCIPLEELEGRVRLRLTPFSRIALFI